MRIEAAPTVSEELGAWLEGDGPKTVDGLIDLFGPKSFALLFVILLGVPALPLPTGGVPRRWLFHHRASNAAFGLLVIAGAAAAFPAPPFSGPDTLPALGVVVLSLGACSRTPCSPGRGSRSPRSAWRSRSPSAAPSSGS
jgi:hypothetical protein